MDAFPEGKYRELHLELSGLLTEDWISNLANFSASVFTSLPDLGPFQGRPACLDIPFDRGVCGKAARTRATVIVEDVHEFPGHIACDERSRSELVVPLIKDSRVIGVLDLDSPTVGRFSSADAAGLESLVALLLEKTSWPAQI
jgi:GAF domain-containing protein